jgi:hypothetical protein
VTEPIVVPAARVVLKPLLFAFGVLAGYFVAWGLVFVMDAVVRAFFGTATGAISWIPYAGKVLSTPLLAIEHKLTSYLGGLEAHFDAQMAARWHALASLVTQLAYDTKAAAILDWNIARKLATSFGNTVITQVVGGVHKIVKVVQSEVHTVTRTVVRVEKIVGTKADAAVARAVGVLEGEIGHVIDWTIPRLRARERSLSDSLGRLWHRVRANEGRLALGAAVALVVTALGRLGLGWIRCRNVTKVGRRICGLDPSQIEGLLLDTLAIVGTVSLIEFIRDAQAIENVALDALGGFIREFPRV